MALIEQLIEELIAARKRLQGPWEGFRDQNRSLTPADSALAREFVAESVNVFGRRDHLIENGIDALIALVKDGYPEDLRFDVSPEVMATLSAQVDTAKAAFATISSPGEAATAEVSVGAPVPR